VSRKKQFCICVYCYAALRR